MVRFGPFFKENDRVDEPNQIPLSKQEYPHVRCRRLSRPCFILALLLKAVYTYARAADPTSVIVYLKF